MVFERSNEISARPSGRRINSIPVRFSSVRLGLITMTEWRPKVASSAGTLSVEQVLAAKPDLAVFSLGSQPSEEERAKIEAAGIPVVVIDFFVHPLRNLESSLRLLGEATGREEQAEAFLAFRRERLDAIAAEVKALGDAPRPRVFLEPHAGMTADCCNSPGRGNVGEIIDFVVAHM